MDVATLPVPSPRIRSRVRSVSGRVLAGFGSASGSESVSVPIGTGFGTGTDHPLRRNLTAVSAKKNASSAVNMVQCFVITSDITGGEIVIPYFPPFVFLAPPALFAPGEIREGGAQK